MDSLKKGAPERWRLVRAHGTAVGLPTEDDMGNSEVGHNALGAGRIFAQGAKLVDSALETGKIFDGMNHISIIFLELVTQGSLLRLYQKYDLRVPQVSGYTRQILHGLKYLHDRNVIHSSNGGMDGSILSQRRRLLKANKILAPCTLLGSKNSRL